jgi:hypothetical protein
VTESEELPALRRLRDAHQSECTADDVRYLVLEDVLEGGEVLEKQRMGVDERVEDDGPRPAVVQSVRLGEGAREGDASSYGREGEPTWRGEVKTSCLASRREG